MPSVAVTSVFTCVSILQKRKPWLWAVSSRPGLVPDWLHPVFRLSSVSSSRQNSLCLHLSGKMVFSIANSVPPSYVRGSVLMSLEWTLVRCFLIFQLLVISLVAAMFFRISPLGIRTRCYKFRFLIFDWFPPLPSMWTFPLGFVK